MYKTIDLFAGAGGLSFGFLQTGRFQIVLAAENNFDAAQTYRRNHSGTDVTDDVRKIDYAEVIRKYGDIDVVIGGPPCQGFSNANRQRAILSANNGLVKEYVRAIVELKPKVFLMENVSALKSEVHRFYVAEGEEATVEELGLTVRNDQIELCPKASELIPLRSSISSAFTSYQSYLWTDAFYNAIKVLAKKGDNISKFEQAIKRYKSVLLKYSEDKNHCLPEGTIGNEYRKLYDAIWEFYNDSEEKCIDIVYRQIGLCYKIQDIFWKLRELKQNKIQIKDFTWDKELCANVRSYSVLDYIECVFNKEKLPYKYKFDILNAAQFGAPQKRERFIMLGSRIGDAPNLPKPIITDETQYRTVKDAIADLESIPPTIDFSPLGIQLSTEQLSKRSSPLSFLCDSSILYNHFRTNTGKVAQERFDKLEEGQNFHDLPDTLKNTYSHGERTQSTIYLKLKYNEPSGTVLNVRKSMWIHPKLNRALSAREAARLQTFPDSFVFEGSKNAQYQQIGNAVPPILAKAVAEQLSEYLDENDKKQSIADKVLYKLAVDPYRKQTDIARDLGVAPSYISMTIKKLHEKGRLEDVRGGKRTGWKVLNQTLNE